MSKRTGPTRVKLADYKERKDREGRIEIETDDGQVFTVPPPELWPDEFTKARKDMDPETQVRQLLGDEATERYQAAGGTIMALLGIVGEELGAQAGE